MATLGFEKKDPRVTITTKFGEIKIRFYPDEAPRHVENFVDAARVPDVLEQSYTYAWFVGCAIAFVLHVATARRPQGPQE